MGTIRQKRLSQVLCSRTGMRLRIGTGETVPACFLMTVRKKQDQDWRGSAEELAGVEGVKHYQNRVFKKKSTLNKRKDLNVRILYFLSLRLDQKTLIKYHLKDSVPNFGVIICE